MSYECKNGKNRCQNDSLSGENVYFIPSYIFSHMIVHMLGILNGCMKKYISFFPPTRKCVYLSLCLRRFKLYKQLSGKKRQKAMIMKHNRSHLQRLFRQSIDERWEDEWRKQRRACKSIARKLIISSQEGAQDIRINRLYLLIDRFEIENKCTRWCEWMGWIERRCDGRTEDFREEKNVLGGWRKEMKSIRSRTEHTKRRGFYDWQIGSFFIFIAAFFWWFAQLEISKSFLD